MMREQVKIALLVASYILCLGSLVTSHKSFQMGPRDLPLLQPQVKQFCKAIYKSRNQCLDDRKQQQKPECPTILHQAAQCEGAVKQAYRNINTAGCPYQLRDVTLCELERCGGYHGISVLRTSDNNNKNGKNNNEPLMDAVEGCIRHCDAARKQLDKCIQYNVQTMLQKYGIAPQVGLGF